MKLGGLQITKGGGAEEAKYRDVTGLGNRGRGDHEGQVYVSFANGQEANLRVGFTQSDPKM